MESRNLHRRLLIDRHHGVYLVGVTDDSHAPSVLPCTTEDINVRIRGLHGSSLGRDRSAATLTPLELLLDESLEFEVKEVDVVGGGLQVVDTVLVLVAIARAHRHH